MAKAIINVVGSIQSAPKVWVPVDLTSREAVESCVNLAVWCSSNVDERDGIKALEAIREKFPSFVGSIEVDESAGKHGIVKMWKESRGTSLEAILDF